MFKKLLPFLLAFVLPIVLIYAWWGGFSSVTIVEDVRGPYVYAYLENTGDYAKLPDVMVEAKKELIRQKIAYGLPISVLYSNPELVRKEERLARTGFLVTAVSPVKPPLKLDTIPARRVLVAAVHAGQLLAPSRAYTSLDGYRQAHGGGIVMPTVELYKPAESALRMGEFSVEMELR